MFDLEIDDINIQLPPGLAAATHRALDVHLETALARRAERKKPPPARPSAIIAEGAGAGIPDDVAARVAGQWAESVAATFSSRIELFTRDSAGGNEVAQRRFVARLSKRLGPSYLAGRWVYGSRAKFAGVFYFVDGVSSFGIRSGRSVGASDWIAICGGVMERQGARDRGFVHSGLMTAFSRHALARMIQRAGLQSADAIPTVLRAALPALMVARMVAKQTVPNGRAASWLIPVRLPSQQDPIVLVFGTASPDDAVTSGVVRTALRFEMINPAQQDACSRLLQAMPERVPGLSDLECWRPLAPLFNAVRQE